MSKTVYVYDPTTVDKQSQVRGVGRYLQILKENFPEFRFTNDLSSIIHYPSSIFVNPFFNFLSPPPTTKRVTQKQAAVIHDLIPLKYPNYFPMGLKGKFNVWLNKLALKNYETIITVSETVKKDIVRMLGVNENKVRVVYHCLPRVFVNSQPATCLPADRLRITNYCMYVGDATWNKNLVNLAKAIKIINATCVFVGRVFQQFNYSTIQQLNNPWQKELKQFFQEVNGDKRFVFAGYVSDSDLIKLYQQAVVNILPSRDEGFGFSWLEAASQRCPTVVNSIPVFHEIAADSAVFCDSNNIHDLANAIGELYFNRNTRNNWSGKAYERSRFFSAERFKKDCLRALEAF